MKSYRGTFLDWRVWFYGGCILAVGYMMTVMFLILETG
jgi:hypothetical protein